MTKSVTLREDGTTRVETNCASNDARFSVWTRRERQGASGLGQENESPNELAVRTLATLRWIRSLPPGYGGWELDIGEADCFAELMMLGMSVGEINHLASILDDIVKAKDKVL